MRAVLRLLRSPKLALGLVLGVAAYSVLGTVFPQESLDPAKAAAWQLAHPGVTAVARPLGMFAAFGSPVFFALIGLLTVSTAVCAWARTRAARRSSGAQPVTDHLRERLARRPRVVAGPINEAAHPDVSPVGAIANAMRKAGYRTTIEGDVVSATRSLWGAWASPVFHWLLVGLFVVISLGQMTRAEGRLPIPVGGGVIDATENYEGPIDRGALYPGHSGLELRARDLQLKTVVDGMDRGESAIVGLYRSGTVLAERRIYPNAPLRWGALLVHPGKWGYAPLLAVEDTAGEAVATAYSYIDQSAVTSDGVGPGGLSLTGGAVQGWEVGLTIPITGRDAKGVPTLARSLRVTVTRPNGTVSPPVLVEEGQRIEIAPGAWLRFVRRGMFVAVSVADDWSVPWIYALLIGASIALAIAVFFPPRRVWLMAVRDGEGLVSIHAVTREQRGSPAFPDQVATIMSTALPDDVEVRVVCN